MLWFSGMAAGLSIGLTWLARLALGGATGAPGELPGDLLYPVGFLIVVLGRYVVAAGITVGGVVLVAVINYGQTRDARVPDRDCDSLELDWREFVTGFHVGRMAAPVAPERESGVPLS
jgi:formate/nitrite transporter FocA (FNT family)